MISQVAERSGGNPLFAEEMVNRLIEDETVDTATLPAPCCSRCWPPVWTPWSPTSGACSSTPRLWARCSGTALPRAATAAEEGLELGGALAALGEGPAGREPRGRISGEREYAFKHVLIRDIACSMLPKAVRSRKHVEVGQFIRERAGDRADAFVGLVAEHYARAATLGAEAGIAPDALHELRADAVELHGGRR